MVQYPLPAVHNAKLPLWGWGVAICVLATALTALGLVLQKLSHTRNSQKDTDDTKKVYYKQPWWLAGFAIFVVAQIINLISMSMAPQVMLSCLGATALIFNAVFAWWILGERLHLFEAGCIVGLVLSVVMVISTTPVVNTNPAAGDVLHGSVGPLFEKTFLVLAAGLVVFLALLRFTVVDSDLAKAIPDVAPVLYVLCSAVASGYTVNFFKASSEFIMAWPETRPHVHWECYMVLVLACVAGATQVHFLNNALNLGSAMMVVPTYFSLSILAQLGISQAIVVCVPDTTEKIAIFICGIALILVFIVLFVRAKIFYEEQPDAEIVEVLDRAFQSWPSSPAKAGSPKAATFHMPTEDTRLLAEAPSTPPSMKALPVPVTDRHRSLSLESATSLSSYAPEAFQDSFPGRERAYTVSMIGLGIS